MGNLTTLQTRRNWTQFERARICRSCATFCAIALLFLCAIAWPGQADAQCASLTTLMNGTTADAVQVMNNFTAINTNCAPLANPTFTGLVGVGGTPQSGVPFWVGTNDGTGCQRVADIGLQIGGSFNCNGAGPAYLYPDVAINGRFSIKTLTAGTANALCYDTTTVPNAVTVSTCSSDERLKTAIAPIDGTTALDQVMRLRPVSFVWRREFSKDPAIQFGLLAQEVQRVWPNLVSRTAPTSLTPDGTLSINFNALYAPIIASIQQVNREAEGVKAVVIELKAANDREAKEIEALKREIAEIKRERGIHTAAN